MSKGCLPVAYELPDQDGGETWTEAPMSANEFLARVRREARTIPDVMTSSTPMEGAGLSPPHAPQQPDAALFTEILPLQEASEEWQVRTLAHFGQIRRSIGKARAQFEEQGLSSAPWRRPVPPLKASRAWHLFCFGAPPYGDDTEKQPAAVMPDVAMDEDAGAEQEGESGDDAEVLGDEGALGGLEGLPAPPAARQSGPKPADPVATAEAVAAGVDWAAGGAGNDPGVGLMLQLDLVATSRVLTHHIG